MLRALAVCLLATSAQACDQPPWVGVAMDGTLVRGGGPTGPVAAWFEDPTERYGHGILGDAIEAGTLVAQLDDFPNCITGRVELPDDHVFEDVAPRLVDLDRDGAAEIVVVRTSLAQGAQLAVYGLTPDGQDLRLIATTPYIGQTRRWLAPVGAADMDGDGAIEVAFVDRPHLARILRVWRFEPETERLVEVAAVQGLTNHLIGDPTIPGGIRDCGAGPEMITADAAWTRVIATRLSQGRLLSRDVGPMRPGALDAALAC